jgi:PAS domain S-box-containing protein
VTQALRVLIADDAADDAELVERQLRHIGLEFVARRAADRAAFERSLVELAPNLILSDYSMGAFDALQAIALTRAHDPDVPFIVVTGTVNDETAAACIRAGANDYVIKEHLARLAVVIPAALDKQRASSEARRLQSEREQLLVRETRQRKVAETLAAANLALAQGLELDASLDTLLDHLGRLVPYDSASVMLLEGEATLAMRAQRRAGQRVDLRTVPPTVFDARQNRILSDILSRREPVLVADAATDGRWERREGAEDVRGWFGVPLVVRGKAIGIYSVDATTPGFFTEEHVALALALAPSAASAVEIARLLEELREAAEFSQQVIASVQEGIVVHDRDGRCRTWNPFMEELTGIPARAVLGTSIGDAFPGGGPADAQALALAGDSVTSPDFEFRRPGTLGAAWLSVRYSALRDAAGAITGVIAVVRDITEQKRMEEGLRQAQKMEAVGRLAGGVAHDFNNILNVITGYGDILLDKTPDTDPDHRRVAQILRAAERAAGLTRQLLAFSRKQVLEPRVLEPSGVLTDLRKMLERLIGEDIDFELRAGAAGRVKVDPGQLEQVVMNLAVNARDAMPTGGSLVIETCDVDVGEEQLHGRELVPPGRYVSISVADSGHGMDEATQARVFEPFFTTKAEGQGTGLGLATVYGIVRQSGGYVWMESTVGQGTVFHVHLPRVEETPWQARPKVAPAPRRSTETVLVVEDEPAARELIAELLRDEGYTVLLAANGQDAVDTAVQWRGPIDLLLTDVVLPKLSGPVVAARVRGLQPEVKVLYMSGYTDDAISRHGVLQPGIVLLQKPFTGSELVRRVGELLDREG